MAISGCPHDSTGGELGREWQCHIAASYSTLKAWQTQRLSGAELIVKVPKWLGNDGFGVFIAFVFV